ncbi:MAG: 3-oxoacyl-[acyl-carrier-protein] reductase [Verrucomicrobiota bacterium]|nr:3-oxoacyl-[acyl-carrier-protein] reductase [Verrucomicrobiota bacterium]MDD8044951.1 3-oxoacyl-[acyl-carrier-protein] reductase [Verrucomicrobiota bacterium]MDD8049935.1 3-oxoacyl-[acyl-carrier-protein] reductase [Verrucomicrobiota bacterium]MDI9383929.1 3-oxoacyl-[acyl-carrier-protein] reductase [Verrucomicrobiota bacterium]
MLLDGKVALVTGASRGIGRAIAKEFASQGAKVALCARSVDALQAVADEIAAAGGCAQPYALDVSSADGVRAVVEAVTEHFGRLDILINNAGITRDGLIARMKDDAWEEVLNTNLRGAFYLTRAAAKIMMRQRCGKIVNISSVVGLTGNPGQANYAASKAGLIGMTRSVAKELGSRNIQVNAIAPGFIVTDMTDSLPEALKAKLLEQIPLGRLGQPEEIAKAALFLASDWSDYVTGQVLAVCGGLT